MRGAYDDRGRGPKTRREGRDAGRRQDTKIDVFCAAARCTGTQGAGEHLSGEARIASDKDSAPKGTGGGEPEAQGILRQEAFVRDPAHPIGAERYGSLLQFSSALAG